MHFFRQNFVLYLKSFKHWNTFLCTFFYLLMVWIEVYFLWLLFIWNLLLRLWSINCKIIMKSIRSSISSSISSISSSINSHVRDGSVIHRLWVLFVSSGSVFCAKIYHLLLLKKVIFSNGKEGGIRYTSKICFYSY